MLKTNIQKTENLASTSAVTFLEAAYFYLIFW